MDIIHKIKIQNQISIKKWMIPRACIFILLLCVIISGCTSPTLKIFTPKAKITVYTRDSQHSAGIYVDGKYIGMASIVGSRSMGNESTNGLPVIVDPGTHEIKVVDNGCNVDYIQIVTLSDGEEITLYHNC